MFQIYHSQVSCVVLLKEYHILISLNSNSFIKDGTIQNMLKKKTYIKVVQNTIHKITDMLIIKKKFTGRKYQKLEERQ